MEIKMIEGYKLKSILKTLMFDCCGQKPEKTQKSWTCLFQSLETVKWRLLLRVRVYFRVLFWNSAESPIFLNLSLTSSGKTLIFPLILMPTWWLSSLQSNQVSGDDSLRFSVPLFDRLEINRGYIQEKVTQLKLTCHTRNCEAKLRDHFRSDLI